MISTQVLYRRTHAVFSILLVPLAAVAYVGYTALQAEANIPPSNSDKAAPHLEGSQTSLRWQSGAGSTVAATDGLLAIDMLGSATLLC